jgi:hypothetical protein
MHGGTQKVYRFDNGFGASVVQHQFSYGGQSGKWELGVVKFDGEDWHLAYDTDIADDVLGYLSDAEVSELLDRIAALSADGRELNAA